MTTPHSMSSPILLAISFQPDISPPGANFCCNSSLFSTAFQLAFDLLGSSFFSIPNPSYFIPLLIPWPFPISNLSALATTPFIHWAPQWLPLTFSQPWLSLIVSEQWQSIGRRGLWLCKIYQWPWTFIVWLNSAAVSPQTMQTSNSPLPSNIWCLLTVCLTTPLCQTYLYTLWN